MVKSKFKGGGLFKDDLTGEDTMLTKGLYILVLLAGLAAFGYIFYLIALTFKDDDKKDSDKPSSDPGGSTFPFKDIPGRISISSIVQGPSSGQAVIYFNKVEAEGTTCDYCTSTFDVNIAYTGGTPNPSPVQQTLTSPAMNGTITFDYGVSSEPPPTQVSIQATSRSVNPRTGKVGGPTTFTQTLPYV